jgi:CBS domain-containing protein
MGTSFFSTASEISALSSLSRDAVDRLRQSTLFSMIPDEAFETLIPEIRIEEIPKGTILFLQGRSPVPSLYMVRSGVLTLKDDVGAEGGIGRLLQEGDIYGGISILMNGGISLKTVKVLQDSALYALPAERFRQMCSLYPEIRQHFVDLYTRGIVDGAYGLMVSRDLARDFLLGVEPFSFLPESEVDAIAAELSIVYHPKDHVLFIQGVSRVETLHILQKGAAQRYIEENNETILKEIIGEGSIFGGISMLLNDGIAIRSLKSIEDCFFYILSKNRFFDLCRRFDAFTEYFTDTFGKRMLDRSYAAIVAQTLKPREESLQFLNTTIEGIYQEKPIYCLNTMSIRAAAELMTIHRCSSILIREDSGPFVGIVTDNDLRGKVIAKGIDPVQPVTSIMSSPLKTIPQKALIFEALMTMIQENKKHLAVVDANDAVVGILTDKDILASQGESPLFLIREIQAATRIEALARLYERVPHVVQHLIQSGAKAQNITRLITTISDTILVKVLDMAMEEVGRPPCRFAFMVLGSEGRKEQTLKTDQDNAIIYEDLPEGGNAADIHAYFLSLGETVCNWLDQVGYSLCKGDVMAKNPRWCQPASVWKQYFTDWTLHAEPKDLLDASIFFDFRFAYGDAELVDDLRHFLIERLLGWAGFFRHLTENALYFRPPLGFFRNFLVESKGVHRDAFDIKSAMMPIVYIARIYALKYGIRETNTQERLYQLYLKKKFKWDTYSEIEHAYSFLMQLRFARQIQAILNENQPPDNYITPKKLTRIEQTMLKEIFVRIESLQKQTSFEFTGS